MWPDPPKRGPRGHFGPLSQGAILTCPLLQNGLLAKSALETPILDPQNGQKWPKMAILGSFLTPFWGPFWDPLFWGIGHLIQGKYRVLAIWAQKGVPKWTPKMAQKWVILGAKKRSKKPFTIVRKAQNLHKSSRLFLTFFSGF